MGKLMVELEMLFNFNIYYVTVPGDILRMTIYKLMMIISLMQGIVFKSNI